MQALIKLLIKSIDEVAKDSYLKIENTSTLRLYEAVNGFVSVNRIGTIDVDRKPENIIYPPNKDKRVWINIFNNVFSEYTKEVVSGDLQFDGNVPSDCSRLLVSPRKMIKIAIEEKNPIENLLENLKYYMQKYEPEELKKIMEEEAETSRDYLVQIQPTR